MRKLILPVALAAMLAIPTAANASPFLSKVRAQTKARTVARHLYADIDRAEDWGVDSPSNCTRMRSNVVECGYTIFFTSGVVCNDAVRVVLGYTGLTRTSFPYEADCE